MGDHQENAQQKEKQFQKNPINKTEQNSFQQKRAEMLEKMSELHKNGIEGTYENQEYDDVVSYHIYVPRKMSSAANPQ